jgi:uncharacterized membrane protein YvbJ
MKTCMKCGRGNTDSSVRCLICGNFEFKSDTIPNKNVGDLCKEFDKLHYVNEELKGRIRTNEVRMSEILTQLSN